MSDNPAKHEVPTEQYFSSILDISDYDIKDYNISSQFTVKSSHGGRIFVTPLPLSKIGKTSFGIIRKFA